MGAPRPQTPGPSGWLDVALFIFVAGGLIGTHLPRLPCFNKLPGLATIFNVESLNVMTAIVHATGVNPGLLENLSPFMARTLPS